MGTVGTTGTQTILAQDSFQRDNQVFWGASSDGRVWQGDANTRTAFSIVNAAGQIVHGQGTLNALLGPTSSNAEVVAQGSMNEYVGTTVNFGVVLRWSNANNWYKLLLDARSITLIKRVQGVSSTLASLPFVARENVSYILRFRAVGATLFAKVWPSSELEPVNWMLVSNDTSLLSGQAGIRVLVQPTTVARITAFLVTDATSGT
jgi:hypothetical protein